MSAEVAKAPRRWRLRIAFVFMVAAYVALVYAPLSAFAVEVTQAILYVLLPIGALTASIVALRKAPDAYRPYWISIVAALALMTIGELAIGYQEFAVPRPVMPFPLSDAAFLGSYFPLLAFVVLRFNARLGLASRIVRLRFIIDALLMATVCLFGIVALIFTQPGLVAGAAGGSGWYVDLAYVVLDVVVLVGIGVTIFSAGRISLGSWAAQTAAAVAVMAGADLVYWLVASGGSGFGNLQRSLLNVAWMISYFLFAHAAGTFIAGRFALDPELEPPADPGGRRRRYDLIPTASRRGVRPLHHVGGALPHLAHGPAGLLGVRQHGDMARHVDRRARRSPHGRQPPACVGLRHRPAHGPVQPPLLLRALRRRAQPGATQR